MCRKVQPQVQFGGTGPVQDTTGLHGLDIETLLDKQVLQSLCCCVLVLTLKMRLVLTAMLAFIR
jgi:hypothetical protein